MMSQLMLQPRQMSVSLVVRRANSLTQKELRCPLQAVTYSATDPSSYVLKVPRSASASCEKKRAHLLDHHC